MVEGYEIEENTAEYVRIAKLEEWRKHHERRIQIIEEQDIAPTFAKVTMILENQVEMSKERQLRQEKQDQLLNDQMNKLANILDRVEGSYKDLHYEVKDMKNDIHVVKVDVEKINSKYDSEISTVNSKVRALEDDKKINLWDALKKGIAVFLVGLTGALAGLVAYKLGWK